MISNTSSLISKLVRSKHISFLTAVRSASTNLPPKSATLPASTEVPALIDKNNELETMEDTPSYFTPTFNFAAYVNKSETLQKFVELGVDLSKIEKKKGLPQFVLKLDFERDVKNHLMFLHDIGIPAEHFGHFLTKNPLIFKESLEDLETRVYYLRSKKFSKSKVSDIVSHNPYWLNFTTQRIDKRLGWFQKNFELDGDNMRFLVHKQPRLITYNLMHVREATFKIREEMGFDKDEVKVLLLAKPNLWMNNHEELISRFDYVHKKMKISHDKILQAPEILSTRKHRLRERHEFLKFLGKDQYDETQPGYVSFIALIGSSDKDFVLDVAKSTFETYDNFLKTL